MKVSVIIPTHNRSELLVRAVKSVLNQTYQDFEIIIVSDGSNDNTGEVIKKLKKMDSRVKGKEYYPSKGGNFARNLGINLSSGELVSFLDDDDEWFKDKLECQVEEFKKNNDIGLVYTGIEIIYVKEAVRYISKGKFEGDLSKKILFGNIIGSTSSVMIKSNILKKSDKFDEDMQAMQDYDLWIRLCQESKVGVVRDEKVRYYNYTGEKQISLNTEKYELARKKINEKYSDLYRKLTIKELKRIKSKSELNLAERGLRNNQKIIAFKYLKQSCYTMPNLKSILYFFLLPFSFSTILRLRKLL